MSDGARVPTNHVRVAKLIGENSDGMTLFLPKNEQGSFQIEQGDQFFTVLFLRSDGDGMMESWVPWEAPGA